MKVLVIEDNDLVAETTSVLLESLGHQASIEPSSEEAISRLKNETYDLIVSDYNVGNGPTGVEVLRKARCFNPQAHRILMSANHPEQIGDLDGAVFLQKPFGCTELEGAISQSISA